MIPWRRKWQPTPVFLPGRFHGQKSLMGYSPWGCKRVRHDLAINNNDWWEYPCRPAETSSTTKETKEESQWDGQEVGTWYSQDPCTQLKLSSDRWEFSPRSEGSEPHIWLCSLGALHWEDEPLELLAVKASKAYIQVTQKAMGNRLHS